MSAQLKVRAAAAETDAIDICGKHVAGGQHIVVVQVVNLIKVGDEQRRQLQDQHDHDAGHDAGQRDVREHLPAIGAVDGRAFIQRWAHARQRRQIDDGGITGCFDDVGDDQNPPEHLRPFEKVNRLAAQPLDDLIDGAADIRRGRILQKYLYQTGENNPGKKIRKIYAGLYDALDLAQLDLVNHQRKKDRKGEAENQVVDVDDDRVLERPDKVWVREHPLEMLEPGPGRPQHAKPGGIVLKRKQASVHGAVVEHRHKAEAWQHQKIQEPVFAQMPPFVYHHLPLYPPLPALSTHACPPCARTKVWNLRRENAKTAIFCIV